MVNAGWELSVGLPCRLICAVSPRASSGMASGVSGASVQGQDRLNGREEQWIDGGDGMKLFT